MEADAMRFLLEVRARLNAGAGRQTSTGEATGDLQAVERTLPDTDWFELEEVRDAGVEPAGQGTGRSPPHLEF